MTHTEHTTAASPLTEMKIWVVGLIGSLVLRLLNATLRWEEWGFSDQEQYWVDGPPRVLVFWHGRQLLMPWIYLNHRRSPSSRPISALISQHTDGRMIAKAMAFLGVRSIAGSSTRGGREALFELIRTLQRGEHIGITPDGPRGPVYKLKPGVVRIAQRSGAKIYPTTISAERYWQFRSWDHMILPKPFSRALLVMGSPISVPSELSNEDAQRINAEIEAALIELTARADRHFTKQQSGESI